VHKIRRVRVMTYATLWLGPLLLLAYNAAICWAVGNTDAFIGSLILFGILAVVWLPFGHWPARWMTPYIMLLSVRRMVCPHCREAYELRSRWGCSCGYVDHRIDRHILLFSCPKCGKRAGWIGCQRCESTMLL
jgi:hypothetical protein